MPAQTYDSLATTTLGSAGLITFSSISGSYTDLRIVLVGTNASINENWRMRFNSDTGSNYSYTRLTGQGTSALSNRAQNQTSAAIGNTINQNSTTIPAIAIIDIFSYAGSTNKTVLSTVSADTDGSGSILSYVNLWRSTSAITSIDLLNSVSSNFATGTMATLYGIKRE